MAFLDTTNDYVTPQRLPQGATPRRRRGATGANTFTPRTKNRFGRRKLPVPDLKGLGIAGSAGVAFDAADDIGALAEYLFAPNPDPFDVVGGGWYLREDCGRTPGNPPYLPGYQGPRWELYNTKRLGGCQDAQAPGGFRLSIPGTFTSRLTNSPDARTVHLVAQRTVSGVTRVRYDKTWWRDANGGLYHLNHAPTVPFSPMYPAQNPNVARYDPAISPGDPWAPSPVVAPAAPAPFYFADVPPGNPLPPAHQKARPRPNEKEKKVISRAAKVGIWLWNMFDTVSELGEIGGAFYDALPKEYQTCEDKAFSMGQYGLVLTECSAKAIWDHFDKIDPATAFKNIAKNVAEDMTVGAFHRFLSKLYPPGISFQRTAQTHFASKTEFEAYVVKKLGELWEFLGI